MMSHKKNLHSVYIYVSTDIRRSTRPIKSQQTVTKMGKKDIRTIYTVGLWKKVDKSEESRIEEFNIETIYLLLIKL